MRRGLLLLALTLTACTHSDQDRAKDKAKEAEGQLKRDAEKASREIKRDAEEAKQKIGQGLEKAGREMQETAIQRNGRIELTIRTTAANAVVVSTLLITIFVGLPGVARS